MAETGFPLLDEILAKWVERKIITDDEARGISAQAQKESFHLARVWDEQAVKSIKDLIGRVLNNGGLNESGIGPGLTEREFAELALDVSGRFGEGGWYADLVYRNNVHSARMEGMRQEMFSPEWAAAAPYWQFFAAHDNRNDSDEKCPDMICRKLDKVVFRKSDSTAMKFWPALHHNAVTGDTLVRTARGEVPIRDVIAGEEVLTHAGNWQPAYAVSHKVVAERRIRKLLLSSGRTLRITDEHPVLDASSLDWRKVGETRVGDILFEYGDQPPRGERALDRYPKDAPPLQDESGVPDEVTGFRPTRGVVLSVNLHGNLVVRESDVEDVVADGVLSDDGLTSEREDAEDVTLRWCELSTEGVCKALDGPLVTPGETHRILREHSVAASPVDGARGRAKPPRPMILSTASPDPTVCAGDGDLFGPRASRDPVNTTPLRNHTVGEAVRTFDGTEALAPVQMLLSDEVVEALAIVKQFHASTILSIADEVYSGELVDLSVEDDESYVAGGVIVHNCRCYVGELGESTLKRRGLVVRSSSEFADLEPQEGFGYAA